MLPPCPGQAWNEHTAGWPRCFPDAIAKAQGDSTNGKLSGGVAICAVDIDDGKLAHTKAPGADLVINAKAGAPVVALKKEMDGGPIVFSITAPPLKRVQAGCWHDPEARYLLPGRAAAGRISSAAVRHGSELENHPAVHSSARAGIWPKLSPSQPTAKSRPISSCSLCRRSTESSIGSSMAMRRRGLSSNSCGVKCEPGARQHSRL